MMLVRAMRFGSSGGFSANSTSAGFKISGINARDFSGFSVSSAGDVNGGFDDITLLCCRLQRSI